MDETTIQRHVEKFIARYESEPRLKKFDFAQCMGGAKAIWDVLGLTEEEYYQQYNKGYKTIAEVDEPQTKESSDAVEHPTGESLQES